MELQTDFLTEYLKSFGAIEGAFQFDAALLFMAYNQLIRSQGVAGDTLEIGVRHGLSAIAVAALRGAERRFCAVDLFDQSSTLAGGSGNKNIFVRNLKGFHQDDDFLQILECDSATLIPSDPGSSFSFCHVDGGHSDAETYHDLELCSEILLPGGLLALDDYFNASFPGVSEGAVRFNLNHPEALTPIAIGFNKVLFQKPPYAFSLNAQFANVFSHVPRSSACLWGEAVNLFWLKFQPFFNLERSTPLRLCANPPSDLSAAFVPQVDSLVAQMNESIRLPVQVHNTSAIPFHCDGSRFGLSYHLLSSDGVVLEYDNRRKYFEDHLEPGAERLMALCIVAPAASGHYLIEIDLVWEGVAWFKDKGNPTRMVSLTVS
jgi:hypothetical protein